ncbi:MAG: NRDE family protein, partial [bacterium]|nr:NRDE family protein [bacterium]
TYGTRSSQVVLFDRTGTVTFVEQSFDHGKHPVRFRFDAPSGRRRPS